jgi:predicted house-cleaning noncanonical NTP pyrophosphatase (MazG superfamily)
MTTEGTESKKVSPRQLLQDTRGTLSSVRRSFEEQKAIREAVHKDSLAAALSARQKAVNALKDRADKRKAEYKAAYDAIRETAQKKYDSALAAVKREYDDAVKAAHEAKESAYRKINEEFSLESAPHFTTYRDVTQQLTSKHEEEMADFLKSGERELRDLQEKVRALETELAVKAANTARPMALEESSAA